LFFSFVGTVLGGIWADQSWGRFWGWDPKENGAVLIVIWNALILHARWAGLIKLRGMAVLCVLGNMITTWSWFGTNQLGVGLHSYGFDKNLVTLCTVVWVSHASFAIIGACVPRSIWFSGFKT
jgi:ABC-type transport system involved in cytochrome c biogenesis permease subunit